MKTNVEKRKEILSTLPDNKIASYQSLYVIASHLTIPVLKGPHIIGFDIDNLDKAEEVCAFYKSKGYESSITLSYPYEISALWNEKKKKG